MGNLTVAYCECIKGEEQAEFVAFNYGETIYNCLKCGGAIQDYQDCLGG